MERRGAQKNNGVSPLPVYSTPIGEIVSWLEEGVPYDPGRREVLYVIGGWLSTVFLYTACRGPYPAPQRCEGVTGTAEELLPPNPALFDRWDMKGDVVIKFYSPVDFVGCRPPNIPSKEISAKLFEEQQKEINALSTNGILVKLEQSGRPLVLPFNVELVLGYLEAIEAGEGDDALARLEVMVKEVEALPVNFPLPLLYDGLLTLNSVIGVAERYKRREELNMTEEDKKAIEDKFKRLLERYRTLSKVIRRTGVEPRFYSFLQGFSPADQESFRKQIGERYGPMVEIWRFWEPPEINIEEIHSGEEKSYKMYFRPWSDRLLPSGQEPVSKSEVIEVIIGKDVYFAMLNTGKLEEEKVESYEFGEGDNVTRVTKKLYRLNIPSDEFKIVWRVDPVWENKGLYWGVKTGNEYVIFDPRYGSVEIVSKWDKAPLTEPVWVSDVTDIVRKLIDAGVMYAPVTLEFPISFLKRVVERCLSDINNVGGENLDMCSVAALVLPPLDTPAGQEIANIWHNRATRGEPSPTYLAVVVNGGVNVVVHSTGKELTVPEGTLLPIEQVSSEGVKIGSVSVVNGGERGYYVPLDQLDRLVVIRYRGFVETLEKIGLLSLFAVSGYQATKAIVLEGGAVGILKKAIKKAFGALRGG